MLTRKNVTFNIEDIDRGLISDEEVNEMFFTEKERGTRRKRDFLKAKRKQRIAENYYGWAWYDNLHQYSKNKIHCSCVLCRGNDFRNRHIDTPQEKRKKDYEKEFLKDWNNLRLDFEQGN